MSNTIWSGPCGDCGAQHGDPCKLGCPNFMPGGGTTEFGEDD